MAGLIVLNMTWVNRHIVETKLHLQLIVLQLCQARLHILNGSWPILFKDNAYHINKAIQGDEWL